MKKNRSYKKGEGFKDSSLILIVCEGEKTEPKYFSFFEQIQPRKCVVKILNNEDNENISKSAPKWLIEKLKKYKQDNQIGDGDFVFIVADTDRWKKSIFSEITEYCNEFNNHFLIISNPCFEVWLYYHLGDPKGEKVNTSKGWKKVLHEKTVTGFAIEKYAVNIPSAVTRAKSDDKDPKSVSTFDKHSKVYKIIEVIENKVGKGKFRLFINNFLEKIN